MSAELDLVAKRAAAWSQSANRLKTRLDKVRWLVFGLAIIGALMAAIASQTQDTQGLTGGLAQKAQSLHGILTALGTVLLATGTFVSARLLQDSDIQAWVRMRGASEALKREAFKYATQARPYDTGNIDQKLDQERDDIENNLADLSDRLVEPVGQRSSPTAPLTPEEYQASRVLGQAQKFYTPRAEHYQKIVSRLRAIEFVLALTATIITALAGVIGKVALVGGISFDFAALTAVLTTISGAILAHIEASRYQYLVTSYLAATQRLENAATLFEPAKRTPQAWSDYVNKCEDIIAAENGSWVARWIKPRT